jgi:AAA15 family ATPase/GTPase
MKLQSFRVTEFQSVKDSGVIKVDDIACLVGKNEAGKSALLKATATAAAKAPNRLRLCSPIERRLNRRSSRPCGERHNRAPR